MLYQLSGLQFTTTGFNTHEVSHETSADFAAKDVIGALRPQEFVGEGEDEISFSCHLYPYKFGGLDELGLLDQMRLSGQAQILVRGDGSNLGWRIVTKVKRKDTYLDLAGVGKLIEVDLTVKKCPAPSAASFLNILYSLLG